MVPSLPSRRPLQDMEQHIDFELCINGSFMLNYLLAYVIFMGTQIDGWFINKIASQHITAAELCKSLQYILNRKLHKDKKVQITVG